MSLNIKNEQTHRLVQELSNLTGLSQTAAVTEAVQERLTLVRKKSRQGLAKRLMAIAEDSAPRFKGQFRTIEHGDLLYGEDGLPR